MSATWILIGILAFLFVVGVLGVMYRHSYY